MTGAAPPAAADGAPQDAVAAGATAAAPLMASVGPPAPAAAPEGSISNTDGTQPTDIVGGDTSALELFPVTRVSVLILPAVADGLACVTAQGDIISVDVPARDGRSIELVVAHHLQAQFPELRVLSNAGLHTVRFEVDLRSFTAEERSAVGSLLFSASFVGDDVSALPRYGDGCAPASSTLLRPIAELAASSEIAARLLRLRSHEAAPAVAAASGHLPLHVHRDVERRLRARADNASDICNSAYSLAF